jgi:toxin ParE1/3/4
VKRLVFRRSAIADLRAIAATTKQRWGDEQAAVYVAGLRDRIKSLRAYPLRFPVYGSNETGLRKMICGHHMVFYLVSSEQIEIIRILHEAMDFGSQLN